MDCFADVSGGIMRKVGKIILGVIFAIFSFIALAINWVSHTWTDITFDQIIFHITNPSQGVDKGLIRSGILSIAVPLVLLIALWVVLCIFLKKKKVQLITLIALVCLSIGLSIGLFFKIEKQYGIFDYFKNLDSYSTFIGDNYVDPDKVDIVFPDDKRNVIYIFLESMEITYADKDIGGAFDKNPIQELTDLALSSEGQCFNGKDGLLNGGINLRGCTWTMGGIAAETGAIPVLTNTNNALATNTDSFYPNMVAIGNILENEGYHQVFMCGSDAVFGGRAEYLKEHGNFDIFDAIYARENGYVPEDYNVFWGIEDKKLFNFAKEELQTLASQDEPFNFTMLTVDTHFEDGYWCEDCVDKFGEQYANVMACSSNKVNEFIEWCKQQDFYDNTTIVICGDHRTMDSDFCKDIDSDYTRKVYTCVLNSAVEPTNDVRREFSTLDMMPTTLAAMGCTFKGDKLGLGTNLFADVPTLVETYSVDEINDQFAQNTNYYDRFGKPNPFSYRLLTGSGMADFYVEYEGSDCSVFIEGLENANETISKITGKITDSDGNVICDKEFTQNPDKTYQMDCSLDSNVDPKTLNLEVKIVDAMGGENDFYDDIIPAPEHYLGATSSTAKLVDLINANDNAYVFLSVKDEALGSLTEDDMDALNGLGLNVSNKGTMRNAYVAIYDTSTGKVIAEDTSADPLVLTGDFDKFSYKVASAGYDSDNYSKIIIDDEEYSPNKRGINAVIVQKNGLVLASTYLDTYGINVDKKDYDLSAIEFSFKLNSDGTTASISFPKVKKATSVYIYVWDKDHLGALDRYDLEEKKDSEDKVFYESSEIDMSELDINETYFSIYFYDKTDGIKYTDRFKVN